MKGRIYISGKITGTPIERTREKFNKAEQMLHNKGLEAINPMKNGLPDTASWESHMAIDIVLLMSCETVYMLPCWEDSKGATLEKKIAEITGKKIIYEKEPHLGDIKDAIKQVLGVNFYEITSDCRSENVVFARMIYSQYCHENIEGIKIKDIADDLNRSPASIHYYLRKYTEAIEFYPRFKKITEDINESLTNQYFNNNTKKQ